MAPLKLTFLVFSIIISLTTASDRRYAYARVESCKGCTLNRLQDVKQFVFEDLPLYQNTEFKHIQGALPELVLYDDNNEEIERILLSHLTRQECNDLLKQRGFVKKPSKDEV